MNKRLHIALMAIGVIFIAIGIMLPGEKIVRAAIPPKGEAYLDTLIAGMRFLKFAMVTNGLLALLFKPLKKYLWDVSIFSPTKPLRPFLKQPTTGNMAPSEWSIILGIVILALVLRVIGSTQSLYGDEIIVQQMYISRGLPVIFTYFAKVPQHVMYSVLAWFFERLPLPIELSYRLPAILFGTGAVTLTYLLARQVFDRMVATVTGILSAAAFFGIAYSQVAKGYSATHCMALLAFLAIIRIVTSWPSASGWWMLGISLVSLGHVHLYNAYLCVGLTTCVACVLLWCGGGLASLKRLLLVLIISGAALFLLYSMQLPQILDQMARASTQPEEHLSLNILHGWLAQLTFWGECWQIALLCLGIACIGMIALLRREPVFTLLALGTPSILLALVALQSSWIYPRYLLFTLPLFLIFCMEGARVIGRTAGVILFALIFLLPTTHVLANYYQVGHQNIRGAAQLAVGKQAFAYGGALDLFAFYNPGVKPVSTLTELQNIKGDVYLMYGWRKSWRGRENEFSYIDQHFTVVKRFKGMTMDLFETDGDVVLLHSNREYSK